MYDVALLAPPRGQSSVLGSAPLLPPCSTKAIVSPFKSTPRALQQSQSCSHVNIGDSLICTHSMVRCTVSLALGPPPLVLMPSAFPVPRTQTSSTTSSRR